MSTDNRELATEDSLVVDDDPGLPFQLAFFRTGTWLMVGGSLTERTVKVNESLTLRDSSATVTVITAVPIRFSAGVIRKNISVVELVKRMLPLGRSCGLDVSTS